MKHAVSLCPPRTPHHVPRVSRFRGCRGPRSPFLRPEVTGAPVTPSSLAPTRSLRHVSPTSKYCAHRFLLPGLCRGLAMPPDSAGSSRCLSGLCALPAVGPRRGGAQSHHRGSLNGSNLSFALSNPLWSNLKMKMAFLPSSLTSILLIVLPGLSKTKCRRTGGAEEILGDVLEFPCPSGLTGVDLQTVCAGGFEPLDLLKPVLSAL